MERMPEYIKATYEGENKGDYALKAKIALEGIADHPEEKEYAQAYASSFLLYAKKYEESIDLCRKILPQLTIWDCKIDTYNTLINCFTVTKRTKEALEVRLQLQDEDGQAVNHLEDIAKAYKEAGDIDNSIVYYLRYIKSCNDYGDTETLTELAALYEIKKEYENSARYLLQAARNACAESQFLWFDTGRALALAGKEDEAKFYFEVALKIMPDDAQSHYMMGQLYQNKSDSYRALHHYTEALKIQPDFAEVYNNMGSLSYNEDGNIKEAIDYIEKALTLHPDEKLLTALYLNLARLYDKIRIMICMNTIKQKCLSQWDFQRFQMMMKTMRRRKMMKTAPR